MSRSGAEHRERLFDLYSGQLDRFGVEPPSIFVCPLCRCGFSRDALVGETPLVSLAHVVPEAQGGRLFTLTCTSCNNSNGAQLEGDLIQKFKYDDWCQGVGGWNARLSGTFGNLGVEFRRSKDTSNWGLYIIPQQTNPTAIAGLDEWVAAMKANPGADIRWNISWSARIRPRRVAAAIYQSAYLMMFACFGYDFAFNPRYETLREQLLRPDEELWPGRINMLASGDWCEKLGQREGGVMLVREPEPCIAVMLKFRPRGGSERVIGVLLPRPDDGTDKVPTIGQGDLDGVVVPCRPDILPTYPRRLSSLWRRVQSGLSTS